MQTANPTVDSEEEMESKQSDTLDLRNEQPRERLCLRSTVGV